MALLRSCLASWAHALACHIGHDPHIPPKLSSHQGRRCLEGVISLCVRPIGVVHRPLLRSAGFIHSQLLARRNRHEGAAVVLSLVVAFVAFECGVPCVEGISRR